MCRPGKEPELLSIEQATREFGLSVPTLYRHMAAGRLTRHVAPAGRPRVFLDRQELVSLVSPKLEKKRGVLSALVCAASLVLTPACTAAEKPATDPLFVLETPGSQTAPVEIIVADLSGHELFRQSTAAGDALPSLHQASAQVAFWRNSATGVHELVVWNIETRALKVIATSEMRPEVSPLWSVDGTEVITLHAPTPISWAPGASFEGKAEISVASTVGQARSIANQQHFVPGFADGRVIAGDTFSGPKRHVVVDARSGQTLREVAVPGTVAVVRTGSSEVVIALRETTTPGEVTLHAVNDRTGAEINQLGRVYAQPLPLWPGRDEVVFVANGELQAFDFVKNRTRSAGPMDPATYALSFDPLGKFLLAARPGEPFYGTFTLTDGRLASAMKPIAVPSLGRALGLVRIKTS